MVRINLLNLSTWLQDYFWLIIIVAVVLIAIATYLIYHRKPKKIKQIPVEDEKIQSFVECYGGLENIDFIELDGRRLKLQLNQIDLVDIERFKSLGATGIFISGNQVKMVLPYDMQKLVDYILFKKMEGKV